MDLATLNRPSATRPLLIFSIAFSFLVTLAKQLPALLAPDAISVDDVRVHIYWMRRFQDPELFRNDLLTDFAASPFFAKRALTFLYYLASNLIDPVSFTAVLPLVLVPITALYLFRIGRLIGDNVSATVLVLIYLPIVWGLDMSGLQRDFAVPLLVAFLYYLMRGFYGTALSLLILQALLYPPILLVSQGIFGLCAFEFEGNRLRLDRKKAIYFAAGLLSAFALLAPDYLFYRNERLGPMVTRAQTLEMPEFHADGHDAHFQASILDDLIYGSLLQYRQRHRLNRFLVLLYVSALAIAFTLRRERRRCLPREVLALLLCSASLLVMAHLFWPILYHPSRYTERTIPLVAMIFVATNLLAAASAWVEYGRRMGLAVHFSSMPAVLLVTFILTSYFVVWKRPTSVRCPFPALNQYLLTLPKDVLIAGHPLDMDWVPTCARRKVLVNNELSVAFYQNYYREIKQRLVDSLAAYYADSPDTIRRFARKYGVDYLVVDESDFTREAVAKKGTYPFEPFRTYVSDLIIRNAAGRFALLDYPYGRVVWRSETKFVLRVSESPAASLSSPSM